MLEKPDKPMPSSSWMIPGGNSERKKEFIKAERYPMKSEIKKNLGGPLSEVFFSCLTPSQKNNIGYTPTLQGPGRNLWVSPSDILIGKVRLTPPFTIRAQKALTHKKILKVGAEIEDRFYKKYELELSEILRKKEVEMQEQLKKLIEEALTKDREEQYAYYRKLVDQSILDTSTAYQKTLEEALAQQREENGKLMEDAVEKTKREMELELCRAVKSRSNYLSQQFDFQLALRESSLVEKYENKIKKLQQECDANLDKAQKQYVINLKKVVAHLEAEHVTDLLMQSCQKSKIYHSEMKELEFTFENWFSDFFDKETVGRDFTIIELKDEIKELNARCEQEKNRLQEVFRHFQKFINFALKEKPGQAEFLLSLEKVLKEETAKVSSERDVYCMARTIIEYLIKQIEDVHENTATQQLPPKEGDNHAGYTTKNFRDKIQSIKLANRKLHLVGEENVKTLNEDAYIENTFKSLRNMLKKNPSVYI